MFDKHRVCSETNVKFQDLSSYKFCSKHGKVKKHVSIVSGKNTNEQSLSKVRLLL